MPPLCKDFNCQVKFGRLYSEKNLTILDTTRTPLKFALQPIEVSSNTIGMPTFSTTDLTN